MDAPTRIFDLVGEVHEGLSKALDLLKKLLFKEELPNMW
jgi:hypothetical protein